jgi:hypothetical protein
MLNAEIFSLEATSIASGLKRSIVSSIPAWKHGDNPKANDPQTNNMTTVAHCVFSTRASMTWAAARSIYYDPRDRRRLTEGMVITIEPFLSTRATYVLEDRDGWTLKTPDGSLSCQYEHTIVITRGKPIVITAA